LPGAQPSAGSGSQLGRVDRASAHKVFGLAKCRSNSYLPRIMKSELNIAVVGLGFMGVTHLKAYQKIPGARIVAVCDAVRQPENGVLAGVGGNVGTDDAARLDMNEVKAYRHLDEVLGDTRVDLVDICLPTAEHPRCSIAALQAGKHVVCEKPLARTSALAREIVLAAESSSTYFLPAMCMRFWPGWDWLQETVGAGTYGQVLTARFRRVSSPPAWSKGTYLKGSDSGGALLDLHIHDVDFIQHCFGRPRRVYAQGVSKLSGAIDHVVGQFDLGHGAAISAEGSWIMGDGFGFNMAFTVILERAMVDYDLRRGPDALQLYEEGKAPRALRPEGTDGYVGELSYIVKCVQTGQPPRRVTARDALSAVELCEAEETSIRTGSIVTL
jgi:predicted dehydrogenase